LHYQLTFHFRDDVVVAVVGARESRDERIDEVCKRPGGHGDIYLGMLEVGVQGEHLRRGKAPDTRSEY
jgi:hypothetical protein